MKIHQRPPRKPNDRFNPDVKSEGKFNHMEVFSISLGCGFAVVILIIFILSKAEEIEKWAEGIIRNIFL